MKNVEFRHFSIGTGGNPAAGVPVRPRRRGVRCASGGGTRSPQIGLYAVKAGKQLLYLGHNAALLGERGEGKFEL